MIKTIKDLTFALIGTSATGDWDKPVFVDDGSGKQLRIESVESRKQIHSSHAVVVIHVKRTNIKASSS